MARYGTSHFTSLVAAIRYYKDYGYDNAKEAVKRKIREGEIHIGRPKLKAGQSLATTDGGKRYEIIENPSKILKKLRRGIRGTVKLSKGRLIIKT